MYHAASSLTQATQLAEQCVPFTAGWPMAFPWKRPIIALPTDVGERAAHTMHTKSGLVVQTVRRDMVHGVQTAAEMAAHLLQHWT